jgi:hypothetical protein
MTRTLVVNAVLLLCACGFSGTPAQTPAGWSSINLQLLAPGSGAFAKPDLDTRVILNARCGVTTSGEALCMTSDRANSFQAAQQVTFDALAGAKALAISDYRLCGILPGDVLRCVPTTYNPKPGDDITTPDVQQVDMQNDACTVSSGTVSCEVSAPTLPNGNVTKVETAGIEECFQYTDGTLRCTQAGVLTGVADFELADDHSLTGQDTDDFHGCALMTDQTLKCWGTNFHGQLGNGDVGLGSTTPSAVEGLKDVTALALSRQHTCVSTRNGDVSCWGAPELFGNGVYGARPAAVPGANGLSHLSAGQVSDCGVRSDGVLVCWGGDEW